MTVDQKKVAAGRHSEFFTYTMSTFSKLKEERKEKEGKSYAGNFVKNIWPDDTSRTSASPMNINRAEHDEVQRSMSQKFYQCEGLYGPLPGDLEVRVHVDEPEKGRGIYNLCQRKPGTSPMDLEAAHCNDFQTRIGDVLLSIKPHVAALSNKQLEGHCSNCFRADNSLRRCTGCKILYYCDSVGI
jgi:SET and MYND domain-containing protein